MEPPHALARFIGDTGCDVDAIVGITKCQGVELFACLLPIVRMEARKDVGQRAGRLPPEDALRAGGPRYDACPGIELPRQQASELGRPLETGHGVHGQRTAIVLFVH